MDISVVVPWRPGCPHREAAWSWVSDRYEAAGYEVVTGTCPPGSWIKAAAIDDAVTRSHGDVLVVADADVWCHQLPATLELVTTRPVVIPHSEVHRLTLAGSARFTAGDPGPYEASERPHRGQAGGGLIVLRRDIWDQVPMDPRFVGWGQEDTAWGYALACLTGKIARYSHRLWHLWHPPQPRLNRSTGSAAGRALEARYLDARRDPARMGELVEEARIALRRTTWPSQPSMISKHASDAN